MDNGDLRKALERRRLERPWVDEIGETVLPSLRISDSLREAMLASGNCYEIAARAAIENDLVLVHGWPVGQGGDILGLRYGHAWCERQDEVEFPPGTSDSLVKVVGGLEDSDGRLVMPIRMVFDLSAPKQELLTTPCALYYFAGGIDPSHCKAFSAEDISAELMECGTWGPFRDPPEEYHDDLLETARLAREGKITGMHVEEDAAA